MQPTNAVIIGGGAAGFFCAIRLAELHPDWNIQIIEKSSKVLSKVKVSGGGRCNVTHACPDIENLLQKYPRGSRFLKKAFYQFATKNTIDWFAANGVQLHTEKDGRMFPTTNNSETIIQCFLKKIDQFKIKLLLQTEVAEVKKGKGFILHLSNGDQIHADTVR